MFPGFYEQYRQVHYDGCSLALVPAARLPSDILGVSYPAGQTTIDPRDLLNPILWKGCHGNDLNQILNAYMNGPTPTNNMFDGVDYSDSVEFHTSPSGSSVGVGAYKELLESLYYRAMTDSTWAKAHPQKGFRKSGLHPMVYDVATNTSFLNGSDYYFGTTTSGDPRVAMQHGTGIYGDQIVIGNTGQFGVSSSTKSMYSAKPTGLPTATLSGTDVTLAQATGASVNFFTPRLRGLGWMDTRNRFSTSSQTFPVDSDQQTYRAYMEAMFDVDAYNYLPLLYMGMIVLPPAYKAEQYFRLVLTHRFSWRGFRGASLSNSAGMFDTYYDMNDTMVGMKSDDEKEDDTLAGLAGSQLFSPDEN